MVNRDNMGYAEKMKYRYEFRFSPCKAAIILRQDCLTVADPDK